MPPLLILLIGMAAILGAILGLRLHAFLALLGAAILVSLLAPGDSAVRLTRVAEAFGRTAGNIGIVIALAAVIGAAMTKSGASDRIVRGFLSLLGEERGAVALACTAFVLSLPVFFDTIFFLLAPLARSMYARTNRNYLRYLLAMSASGVATHTLVPPHPGPLAVADTLGIDLGVMILVGIVVALPGAVAGNLFGKWLDRRMPVEMGPSAVDPDGGSAPPADESREPTLTWALLPVLLPVVLIASGTVLDALRTALPARADLWNTLRPWTATLGNANMAMLISATLALLVYWRRSRPSARELGDLIERSLMGAGVVIMIVAAGGAFGAMLQAAQIGPEVQRMFTGGAGDSGWVFLFLAFGLCVTMKIIQGSSTVAMITTAGMIKAMITGITLPFHPVYIATAIAGASLVGSWMNDAGFWVFSKVGGVSERDTLKSWSPLSAVVGTSIMITTVLMAWLLPLR